MAATLIGRRLALAGCIGAVLPGSRASRAQAPHAVRWSSGAEAPRVQAPPGATDCHFHTYDRRHPAAAGATLLPEDASVEDYLALQRRIGTSRGVIIQPSTYGTDNLLQPASMQALGQALGPDRFRVVAAVAEDVGDAELKRLDVLGVRGVCFNLALPGPLTTASLEPLAPRLAALGWHCQINMNPRQIVDGQAVLARLPGRLVFDHLGQVPQPAA